MTYREQLNKLEELEITACSIEVANSCDCLFEFPYTNEEFEQLCSFAEMIYLKSDTLTTDAIATCISHLIREEDKKIDEVLKMDKWDFSGKACYYLD